MGVGKTTIGKRLAGKLSREFYDSDAEIEQQTGAAIPLIFEIEGEQGFRKRESGIIAALVKKKSIVLATGGGAVLDETNRRRLTKNGFVVYLRSAPEILMSRTRGDKTRPLLSSCDTLEAVKDILDQREPLYRELADLIIETDRFGVAGIVDKICEVYRAK